MEEDVQDKKNRVDLDIESGRYPSMTPNISKLWNENNKTLIRSAGLSDRGLANNVGLILVLNPDFGIRQSMRSMWRPSEILSLALLEDYRKTCRKSILEP